MIKTMFKMIKTALVGVLAVIACFVYFINYLFYKVYSPVGWRKYFKGFVFLNNALIGFIRKCDRAIDRA